jgi:membrane-associated phospholipid phosphatase
MIMTAQSHSIFRFSKPGRLVIGLLIPLFAVVVVARAEIPHSANVVADWNEVLTDCIAQESPSPALAARNLAIFHMAIAIAMDRMEGKDEETVLLAGAAAAAQAGQVLYPNNSAKFTNLLSHVESQPGDPQSGAYEMGLQAAREALEFRIADRSSVTTTYVPCFEVGSWQRTCNRPPELPHWGTVRPFVAENLQQHFPPAPPALSSPEYAKALREVQALGAKGSSVRTPEQTLIAKFWADFSYTGTPPGHWNEIARYLVRKKNLTPRDSARLFALLNMAMADAGLLCWAAKYEYNFWRPLTAIHQADKDGNPSTHKDPEWQPLLRNPPHPEYVSGHAAFSGAAARVLAEIFGDQTTFTAGSETLPGVFRTFESFSTCAEEIAASRIYGGIHFRFAGTEGLNAGQAAAESVMKVMIPLSPVPASFASQQQQP